MNCCIYKYLVDDFLVLSSLSSLFLVLILFQIIQFSEGRHLRLETRNEFPNLQTQTKISEKETRKTAEHSTNLHGDTTNKAAYVHGADVPVAPMTAERPPPMPPSQAVDVSRPPPPPGHVDDFRPTVPGHSPGVGHSLQG
ncbi:unnamed protein product [Ilex paraguariensis]|uniref:Uncharacterized protein n=1 Tax=Ilex paraguariensis TaxID=185542 RepID=A0ABC8TCN6_9AQUA